jgi:phosphoribosylformylglycinamidine (FGAM) synthase PurS component
MKKEKMKRVWFFFPFIIDFNVSLYKKREEELGQMTKKSLINPLVTFWYYPTVSVLAFLTSN